MSGGCRHVVDLGIGITCGRGGGSAVFWRLLEGSGIEGEGAGDWQRTAAAIYCKGMRKRLACMDGWM
jgi:hypothetical protein